MSQPFDISKLAIVIPVFNNLSYTQNCLDTLNQAGISNRQIIVVDNGSTDGTGAFLASRPGLQVIHNESNRGCGGAWSQGSQAAAAEWTVVLNNDVLVPSGCFEGLLQFAAAEKIDVVSPGLVEGDCDYDWRTYGAEFMQKMKAARRNRIAHGVCFMVHRRGFEAIGYFSEDLRLGGYEDDEFFRRVRRAGFRLAVTGGAFLHHFGSVTQKSMKSQADRTKALERRAYYRQKTGQTWIKRKTVILRNNLRELWWRKTEKSRFGFTLKEYRLQGRWEYY
jgi:N-acetylglucosaminyl-diphospho-decaprenol L-rhamnosyltransferase